MKNLLFVFKAIADEKRVRILKLLEKRKMCVCELSFVLELSQPAVSRHLKKMQNAGLVNSEQVGFWTNYYLAPDNDYTKKLLKLLTLWLNDDRQIKADEKRCCKANRNKLNPVR